MNIKGKITPRGVVQSASDQHITPYNRNKATQKSKQNLLSVIALQAGIVSLPDCLVCPNVSPSVSETILFLGYLNFVMASCGNKRYKEQLLKKVGFIIRAKMKSIRVC